MPAPTEIARIPLMLHRAYAGRDLAIPGTGHAMKAEKLITLIAIPAYDPTINVNIILIISCMIDV